jgi:hypothetical protein
MEEFTGFLAAVGSILFFGSYGMKNPQLLQVLLLHLFSWQCGNAI